jgi:molybdopterin molybdotransferase
MHFISVEDALHLVATSVSALEPRYMPISECLGAVLAQDILSPVDLPLFSQSAVDGYAICADTVNINDAFLLKGEIKAGDRGDLSLHEGEATRIFTGAPIPGGATHVAMQEHCFVSADTVTLQRSLPHGANIRHSGGQIRKLEYAFSKGCKLNAAAIGALSSMGITEILVYPKPVVSVVVTGAELVSPGQPLQHGQIYESNGSMLDAALQEADVAVSKSLCVTDDYQQTLQALSEALQDADVLIIAGGISVGDYDFVGKSLRALGVEEVFYKVKQKPGKPLFFGMADSKPVFALPGNPAAALTCFYVYVWPTLKAMAGEGWQPLQQSEVKCLSEFAHKGDRSQFLKSVVSSAGVRLLEGQASDNLLSFAQADSLVYIPFQNQKVAKGDMVSVILLPQR